MKKLILTILIIALSITQVSVLGQMATKSEEKSNNKAGGNFYSAEYSIDQLKKLTGVADYEGIKKAIEDINKNYDYTEITSGEYNIDDRLSIHDDPGDNRFIYKISIYFTKDLEQPTIILCAGKAMTVFYSCSGEKFKKIVKDNFLDEPHNSIWTSKCNGAYIDDKFYYYNHTDGTIPNQVYDHSNYSTADSLYKYENGKLLDMEYTEEKAKEIDKAYSKDNYIKKL